MFDLLKKMPILWHFFAMYSYSEYQRLGNTAWARGAALRPLDRQAVGVGQRGQGEFGWGGVSFSVQYGRGGDSDSASVFKEGSVKGGGIPRACSMLLLKPIKVHITFYCWFHSFK